MGKSNTPTMRTLDLLRSEGYTAELVERWFPSRPGAPHGMRKDYLNIIDIIAIKDDETLAVQSTGQDFSGHLRKMFSENENCMKWLANPDRKLMLIGWRKLKVKRGGKATKVRPRIARFFIEDGELVYDEYPDMKEE